MVTEAEAAEIAIEFLSRKGFKVKLVNISSSGGRWLVICRLNDGEDELIVSVGAENPSPYLLD